MGKETLEEATMRYLAEENNNLVESTRETEITITKPISTYIEITDDREEWDYPIEDMDEARANNDYLVIDTTEPRVYEVTEDEFNLIKSKLEENVSMKVEAKTLTWNEIMDNAEGTTFGQKALKVKDTARDNVEQLMQKDGVNIEELESVEDAIEEYTNKNNIKFDESGNILNESKLVERKQSVTEYIISFMDGELHDEYDGEFITEDKAEADALFDELKAQHKLNQVDQYIAKTWVWNMSDYDEDTVEVYFNNGDERYMYEESKLVEEDVDLPEEFYEKICRAYIDTMNLEWVAEDDGNGTVVHGYFENDDYASKNKSKVNNDNFSDIFYGQFTDDYIEAEEPEYYSYQDWEEFYNEYVEDNIKYDLYDLGLDDFYISKEDLDKLGIDYTDLDDDYEELNEVKSLNETVETNEDVIIKTMQDTDYLKILDVSPLEIIDQVKLSKAQFDELDKMIKTSGKSFDELYDELGGWNLDNPDKYYDVDNYFDCYYKSLLVTVKVKDGNMMLSPKDVYVYPSDISGEPVDELFHLDFDEPIDYDKIENSYNENLNEVKQVNNMKIKYNKVYDKYDVITPDGRALEEFDTEEEAIKWAKEQNDFISKKTESKYPKKIKTHDGYVLTKVNDGLPENANIPEYMNDNGDVTLVSDVDKYEILEEDSSDKKIEPGMVVRYTSEWCKPEERKLYHVVVEEESPAPDGTRRWLIDTLNSGLTLGSTEVVDEYMIEPIGIDIDDIVNQDKQVQTESKSLNNEDVKNLLDNGNVVTVGGKQNYTPTDFYVDTNKIVWYKNGEISFGWEKHPSMNYEDLLNHLAKMQKDGFTVEVSSVKPPKVEENKSMKIEDVESDNYTPVYIDQKEELSDGRYHMRLVCDGYKMWINVGQYKGNGAVQWDYDFDNPEYDVDAEDYINSSVDVNDIEEAILKAILTKKTEGDNPDVEKHVMEYLESNQLYPSDVFTADDRVMVDISWGDWKHDHIRCDKLMENLGYTLVEEEVTEEDGSDCYSAIRHYIPKGSMSNLDESVDTKIAQDRKSFIDKWKDHKDFKCSWCGTKFTGNIDDEGRMPNCPHCMEDRYAEDENKAEDGHANKDVHFCDSTGEEIYTDFDGTVIKENKELKTEVLDEDNATDKVVKIMAYGKIYYELSEDEYHSKSEDEIQSMLVDVAYQASEEEGFTVETDEVEIVTESKQIKTETENDWEEKSFDTVSDMYNYIRANNIKVMERQNRDGKIVIRYPRIVGLQEDNKKSIKNESSSSVDKAKALLDLFNELYDGMGDMYAEDEWAELLARDYDLDTENMEADKIIITALNKMDDSAFKDEVDNFMLGLFENDGVGYLKDTLHVYPRNLKYIIKCLNTIKPYASEPDKIDEVIKELNSVNMDLRTTAEEFQRYLHDNYKPWTVLGTTTGPRTYVNLFEVPTEYDIVGADYFNFANRPSDMLENIGYGWKQDGDKIVADLIGYTHSVRGSSVVYDQAPVKYGYSATIDSSNKETKFKEMANALMSKAQEIKKEYKLESKKTEAVDTKKVEDLSDDMTEEDIANIKKAIEELKTAKFIEFTDIYRNNNLPTQVVNYCEMTMEDDNLNSVDGNGDYTVNADQMRNALIDTLKWFLPKELKTEAVEKEGPTYNKLCDEIQFQADENNIDITEEQVKKVADKICYEDRYFFSNSLPEDEEDWSDMNTYILQSIKTVLGLQEDYKSLDNQLDKLIAKDATDKEFNDFLEKASNDDTITNNEYTELVKKAQDIRRINEGKSIKVESKLSDDIQNDPEYREYVVALLKDGAIDDPEYVNGLSTEEFDDLVTNTWMKDIDVINSYIDAKNLNEGKSIKVESKYDTMAFAQLLPMSFTDMVDNDVYDRASEIFDDGGTNEDVVNYYIDMFKGYIEDDEEALDEFDEDLAKKYVEYKLDNVKNDADGFIPTIVKPKVADVDNWDDEKLIAYIKDKAIDESDYFHCDATKIIDKSLKALGLKESKLCENNVDDTNIENIKDILVKSGISNERTLDLMSKDVLRTLKSNYADDCSADGIYYGVAITDAIQKVIERITGTKPSMKFTEGKSIKQFQSLDNLTRINEVYLEIADGNSVVDVINKLRNNGLSSMTYDIEARGDKNVKVIRTWFKEVEDTLADITTGKLSREEYSDKYNDIYASQDTNKVIGWNYLDKLGKRYDGKYYEIVEDTYEYPNGLILIVYDYDTNGEDVPENLDNVQEIDHICINLDDIEGSISDKGLDDLNNVLNEGKSIKVEATDYISKYDELDSLLNLHAGTEIDKQSLFNYFNDDNQMNNEFNEDVYDEWLQNMSENHFDELYSYLSELDDELESELDDLYEGKSLKCESANKEVITITDGTNSTELDYNSLDFGIGDYFYNGNETGAQIGFYWNEYKDMTYVNGLYLTVYVGDESNEDLETLDKTLRNLTPNEPYKVTLSDEDYKTFLDWKAMCDKTEFTYWNNLFEDKALDENATDDRFNSTLESWERLGYKLYKQESTITVLINDSKDMPIAIAFNGKASKPIWHYKFSNMDDLDSYVNKSIENAKAREQSKADRKAQRKLTSEHDIKVGDIFYTSWGYDQTNTEFYEVVNVRGSRIDLKEIGYTVDYEKASYGREDITPVPHKFVNDEVHTVSARADGTVTDLDGKDFLNLYKYSGGSHEVTATGWGH